MKGHIRERAPGHWAIVIDLRHAETGKRGANGIHSAGQSGKRKMNAHG